MLPKGDKANFREASQLPQRLEADEADGANDAKNGHRRGEALEGDVDIARLVVSHRLPFSTVLRLLLLPRPDGEGGAQMDI